VGGRHVHAHGVSAPARHLAPEAKVLATFVFVLAVVTTPREQWWAFAGHAAVILVVAAVAGLGPVALGRRLVLEVPFVAFAVLLPFVGRAPHVDVLGLSLSRPGLWAAWAILAKGTLGVAAAAVLAATTELADLVTGLERLRVPRTITSIMAFMFRYGDVLGDEVHRMRVARESRGDRPGWLWQSRGVAATAGALFVRSYERGERVYLAMASRGYTGSMPSLDRDRGDDRRSWLVCALPAATAIAVAAAAVVTA
jgi:cobalt/nickel transport system permease protein